ncbi:MAG: cation transporter, partial [Acidimicrobiales bacterium]
MTTQARPRRDSAEADVEFIVSGMTCSSCASRVENVLSRQVGVAGVAVNFASEKALVSFDPDEVSTDDLVAAVGKIGYGLAPAELTAAVEAPDTEATLQRAWLRRILVAWPLGLAVLVLSLVWMHDPWARWSALALTVPVQFWAGWPFLHQAVIRARAVQANM